MFVKNINRFMKFIKFFIICFLIVGCATIPNCKQNIVKEKLVLQHFNTSPYQLLSFNEQTQTIYLGEINTISASLFWGVAEKISQNPKGKIVTVDLHSPGGQVVAMKIIMNVIQILKDRGFTVITIVKPNHGCMSACTRIFLEGDQRLASSSSVWMFHAPYYSNKKIKNHNIPLPMKMLMDERNQKQRNDFINHYEKTCGFTKISKVIKEGKENSYASGKRLKSICWRYITRIID